MKIIYSIIGVFSLAISLSSCATQTQGELRKRRTDDLEHIGNASREIFLKHDMQSFPTQCDYMKNYLVNIKHPSQPLYLCERASFNLLLGKNAEAGDDLRNAIDMLEMFFDKEKEKQAVSVWGNESDKVYKGEPFERAILYMLYGLCLLEDKEQVDNALACFKRALLMDGDTEKNEYQSDFGLVFLLAAKCYDLLGEKDERNYMLNQAAKCYLTQYSPDGKINLQLRLKMELEQSLKARKITPLVHDILTWGGTSIGNDFDFIPIEDRQWLEETFSEEPVLDFNTIVIIWNGRGPWFTRDGNNDSARMINLIPKMHLGKQPFVFEMAQENGQISSFIDILGDVNYQAITRGGRLMDKVQQGKSNTKDTTRDYGDFLMSEAFVCIPYVGLATTIIGGGLKEASQHMHVEADTRSWQCLPAEFTVGLMKLSPGNNSVELRTKIAGKEKVLQRQNHTIVYDPSMPVNVVHLFP